jgi:hypothetical protein
MIRLFLFSLQKECWLAFLSLRVARGVMVHALKSALCQFANAVRMIARSARFVPNLIAVKIAANDRLRVQSVLV